METTAVTFRKIDEGLYKRFRLWCLHNDLTGHEGFNKLIAEHCDVSTNNKEDKTHGKARSKAERRASTAKADA